MWGEGGGQGEQQKSQDQIAPALKCLSLSLLTITSKIKDDQIMKSY